jgi:nodulation protein E
VDKRRVAISGLGAISALGLDVSELWDALAAGRSGIGPITQVDTSGLKYRNGAEVSGFRPEELIDDRHLALGDRFSHFALVAAAEALRDSGIELSDQLQRRTAVVTGSCVGGQNTEDDGFRRLYAEGRPRFHPLTIPRVMANSGASLISMALGLAGPCFTLSTACSSANHAIGQAFWLVRSGVADLALAGGSEAPFSLGHLKAWEALRVVSPDTCRPFARDRKGLILGEGGAILVLEPLDVARARGATIYGEITGIGMTADAHHITQPSIDGPVAAMAAALADAEMNPQEIGYINAHGSGTEANDKTEIAAIRQLFGAHAERLAVSSSKSMHGHTLGAAGALEAVATVLALHHGLLPPTANFTKPDPECDLDVVPNRPRRVQVEGALSNSFAFGGLNAVLAFRRHEV